MVAEGALEQVSITSTLICNHLLTVGLSQEVDFPPQLPRQIESTTSNSQRNLVIIIVPAIAGLGIIGECELSW